VFDEVAGSSDVEQILAEVPRDEGDKVGRCPSIGGSNDTPGTCIYADEPRVDIAKARR
jgi:hypothetical protein